MIIQGSNAPIILNTGDIDFTNVSQIQAALFCGSNRVKDWDISTIIKTDGALLLPLGEDETAKLPEGIASVELKWVDTNMVRFGTVVTVPIAPRKNKDLFGVPDAMHSDKDGAVVVEESPAQEILIAKGKGEKGDKGDAGDTPYIGANGDWFIGDTDTGVFSGGEAPYIGENGDWYIGQNDTGVSAIGPQGPAGYTPVRGVDYWTATDQDTIVSEVLDSDEIAEIQTRTTRALIKANMANQAVAFLDYQSLIQDINSTPSSTRWNIGQSFFVRTLNVPDLWVYEIHDTSIPYTYISDAAFIAELQNTGYVRVGYYDLAMLETLKTDLTGYVETDDVPTLVGQVFPVMTQQQYDALTTKDTNTYYCILED